MVAQAPPADRFVPVDVPRVAVSADGSLAAVHEPSRVTLLELPSGTAFAEIGSDPDALASEVAWVGAQPRLLVVSRYDGNSTAHLIDPRGPRTIAEIRLEATMRLAATVGGWALAVGSLGAAVLSSTETHLTAYQFPARVVPVTAGAAAGQFLVALAGSIEEWDPQSRMPRRRLKLPRSVAITGVGGSERLVWMTTQQEPARVEVIPLVNRGQPKAHELPEPLLRTVGHPRSDLVACIGAESGRLYVIDLDGRTRLRVLDLDGIDRVDSASLVIGRMTGVIAAQAGRPIAIARLDGRDLEHDGAGIAAPTAILTRAPVRAPLTDERDVVAHGRSEELPAGSSLVDEPPATSAEGSQGKATGTPALHLDAEASGARLVRLDEMPGGEPPPSLDESEAASQPERPAASQHGSSPGIRAPVAALPVAALPVGPPPVARQAATSGGKTVPSVSERFSAWRDMVRQNQPHAAPAAAAPPGAPAAASPSVPPVAASKPAPPPGPLSPALLPFARPPVPPLVPVLSSRDDVHLSWRDELAAWSQAMCAGAADPVAHGAPDAFAIEAMLARFELESTLLPVLALLYGAHLRGEVGVAPIDVARVMDRDWDEALGRGELARLGICEYARSRVALSPVILRALDELPPLTGALLGPPGPSALLGPCVVVAGDEPLAEIAERCLSRVGSAILVASADAPLAQVVFEARAQGAVAMVRFDQKIDRPAEVSSSDPVIFVVGDAELAERLGVPHLP